MGWCPAPSAWINKSSLPSVESMTNPGEIYWETLLKRDKILIGILSKAAILGDCAVVLKGRGLVMLAQFNNSWSRGLLQLKIRYHCFYPRCIKKDVVMFLSVYVLKIKTSQKRLLTKAFHWTVPLHQTGLHRQTVISPVWRGISCPGTTRFRSQSFCWSVWG